MRLFLYAAAGDDTLPGAMGTGKKKGAGFLDGMPDTETLPRWLTPGDLDYFAKEFERTGFRGGLNRYRNMDRDWEELPELAGAQIKQPALFVAGARDGVLAFTNLDAMKANVLDLRDAIVLPDAGHWTQQERPAEVNKALIAFLSSLD